MAVDHNDDVAASAAVTAVGTTLGFKLLAPEARAAMTAVAGLGKNFNMIDKHDERKQGGQTAAKWLRHHP